MAVNQKLIEASFREAESRVPLSTTDYNIAMAQAKTGVMTDIINAYNQYESGKQKAFDDIAGNVEDMMRKLASGSEQLGGMQQANVQRLKQLQQEFNSVYGNKEKEDEVKFKIEQLASEINSVAAGFGKFGQAYIDGTINVKTTDPNFYNVFGKVWDKDGKYDDVQFSWDDNNKLSVTVDGETQKIGDLFNKLVTKDDAPAIGLGNQGLSSIKLGATKGSTFNETDATRNVESLINTPEKFANLTSSDTFGDISYREALLTNPNIHKVLQTLNKDKYDIDGSGTVDKNDFNTPKNIAVLYDALTDIHDKNFDFEVAKKVASSWYTDGYLRSKFNEGRNMLQEKEVSRTGKRGAYMTAKGQVSADTFERDFVPYINFLNNPKEGQTMQSPIEFLEVKYENGNFFINDESVGPDPKDVAKYDGLLNYIEQKANVTNQGLFEVGFDFIKMNEENAEEYLKENLPEGFTFEQYGLGDAIKVMYGDKSVNINLQPNTTSGEKRQIKKLNDFIKSVNVLSAEDLIKKYTQE